VALRLWLDDRPGVLGAVAARIGALGGNLTGLEVLEREGGVAVDELIVELSDPGDGERLAGAVAAVEGAGVEEVRPLEPDREERGLLVLRAAVAVLESPTPEVALDTLVQAVAELFDLTWWVLADPKHPDRRRVRGPAPPPAWFAAFAEGARGPGADTAGSGVLTAELLNAGLVLGVGRGTPFRGRERRELELLVRVADRVWAGLRPVRPGRA
jgi:hypothetical protein